MRHVEYSYMLLGIGVDDADIGQMRLKLCKLVRRNADAVVLDGNQQPALLYPGAYEQRSLAQRGFYTMKKLHFPPEAEAEIS